MEWISVKDKLPGTDQGCVLVYKNGQEPEVAYFISTGEGCYFCIGSDVKQTWDPEYWMPLSLPNQPERLSEKTPLCGDAIV